MIEYLAAECVKKGTEIHTGAIVKKIEWAKNYVKVFTGNGAEYTAGKVVVTVPVSILHQADAVAHIQFAPAVDAHIKAAGNIGYGGVIKILLEFKTAFWNNYKHNVGFLFCDAVVPTWWTQAPNTEPVITGWLGGPKADALVGTDDETILQDSLRSLATVFGLTITELNNQLVAGKVFNWPASVFSLGAYSYATPLTAAALDILSTPVEDTIYFAGEALYTGSHPGTVEAALVSGKDVAEKIMQAQ
jgi:monoamine oxidase